MCNIGSQSVSLIACAASLLRPDAGPLVLGDSSVCSAIPVTSACRPTTRGVGQRLGSVLALVRRESFLARSRPLTACNLHKCRLQADNAGVLVLSEFAGAAQSLGAGAILVNPWNVTDMAQARCMRVWCCYGCMAASRACLVLSMQAYRRVACVFGVC